MATRRLQPLPPAGRQRGLHEGPFLRVLAQQRGALDIHDGAARQGAGTLPRRALRR